MPKLLGRWPPLSAEFCPELDDYTDVFRSICKEMLSLRSGQISRIANALHTLPLLFLPRLARQSAALATRLRVSEQLSLFVAFPLRSCQSPVANRPMPQDQIMKISEHIRSNRNEDGSVVLDVLRGKMYGLNPVASRILELLGQGLDETQVKAELSRQFSVDVDTIDKDVDEFLLKLAALGVLVFGESAPASKTNQSKSR